MGGTIAYGRSLSWDGDNIGLNTKVKYRDQRGVEATIDIKKFVELAKECKEKDNIYFFRQFIPLIEAHKLGIGVVVIDGLNRIGTELGEKAYLCINEGK
jgi:hypothetical protein